MVAMFVAALATAPASSVPPNTATSVMTEDAACNSVKARVAAVRHFEVSIIASCDLIVEDAQPEGLYVLALHSNRKCEGICSTNIGWFAIQKATGRVFEWDVADWKLGRPI